MQLLLVVVCAITVTAIANRRGLQPSLVVVVLASAISFIPDLPRFALPADLILGVVLPPLLYSAALNLSVVSFARNLKPILTLGVGLVVVSTLATGLVAWWVVPGLALAPALVLGAVVAPPDAVAALAVGRRLGLPKRLMAILTGESLVNDAAALTIYTLTIAAVTGNHELFDDNPLLLFGYAAAVGALLGYALGVLVHWLRQRLRDSGLETALGLLVPFAAYLLAEEVHASGVLAVVVAGFTLGHRDIQTGFGTRLQARQVWASLDALLEAFVFAYMGLQCKFVFADLAGEISWQVFTLSALAVLGTVLLIRPVWVFVVFGQNRLLRGWLDRRTRGEARPRTSWRYMTVISWSGMRGVVTMAAAAGVPAITASGDAFPGREVIVALAFVVAVGTLLIQGPTLPPLIRALRISAPREQEEEAEATQTARGIERTAAEQRLRSIESDPPEGADPAVLAKLDRRLAAAIGAHRAADDRDADTERDAARMQGARETMVAVRRAILAAQREALAKAQRTGQLDDETVRRELERLDYEEAAAAAQ
ncbi:Na+/H+ antiporter [Prauserella marina]|nr:Na+/H+ antiporter [Prauserella marina]